MVPAEQEVTDAPGRDDVGSHQTHCCHCCPAPCREGQQACDLHPEEGAEKQRHAIKQGMVMAGADGWTRFFPFQREKPVENIIEVFNSVGNMDKYLS